jgi:dephospho-CoA kinase
VVIDADHLARRAVEPGTPGHTRVIEAFGRDVLAEGGQVDRKRLAQVVFADPEARRKLEAKRLSGDRGMNPEDAQERMSAQLSDDERERAADIVIENEGSLEELGRVVDDLWSTLQRRAQGGEHG